MLKNLATIAAVFLVTLAVAAEEPDDGSHRVVFGETVFDYSCTEAAMVDDLRQEPADDYADNPEIQAAKEYAGRVEGLQFVPTKEEHHGGPPSASCIEYGVQYCDSRWAPGCSWCNCVLNWAEFACGYSTFNCWSGGCHRSLG